MVSVIKKNKSTQAFNKSKIVKTLVNAGMPKPIADTISKMVAIELKGKTSVKSLEITKILSKIDNKISAASKKWASYKKK